MKLRHIVPFLVAIVFYACAGQHPILALDAAGAVNELRLAGNKNAALILSNNKAYRPDGSRHPHSWSVVDNGELVEWLLGL